MEWDPNNSSPSCVLCGTRWGRVFNRRHHCRHCGRLVCESCSSKRLKLPQSKKPDVPQRVCDACHKMLQRREEYHQKAVKRRDKGLELLFASSFQSQCLIDVFFLDGSYITASIDEMTTAKELAGALLCNAEMALFFVKQDISNPQHYSLLAHDIAISQMQKQAQEEEMPYAKIVAPLYSSFNRSDAGSAGSGVKDPEQRVVRTVLPRAVDKMRFQSVVSGRVPHEPHVDADEESSDDSRSDDSAAGARDSYAQLLRSTDPVALLEKLYRENNELKTQLQSSVQRYDTLRLICSRSSRVSVDDLARAENDGLSVQNAANMSIDVAEEDSFDYAADCGNEGKRESFLIFGTGIGNKSNRTPTRRDSSKIHTTPTRTSIATSAPNTGDSKARMAGEGSSGSILSAPPSARRSLSRRETSATSTQLSLALPPPPLPPPHAVIDSSNTDFDFAARNRTVSKSNININLPTSSQIVDEAEPRQERNGDSGAAVDAANVVKESTIQSKSFEMIRALASEPQSVSKLSKDEVYLIVRSYFHKINDTHEYFYLFEKIFHSILRHGLPAGDSDRSDCLQDRSEPLLMQHLYTMMTAMDATFEYLSDYQLFCRANIKAWLLRMLQVCAVLPITRVQDLQATIECLKREELMYSSTVIEIIHKSIDASLARDMPLRGGAADVRGEWGVGNFDYVGSIYPMMSQQMQNIINTYRDTVHQLLPLLPLEFETFKVLIFKLKDVMKRNVQEIFYEFKAKMTPTEIVGLYGAVEQLLQQLKADYSLPQQIDDVDADAVAASFEGDREILAKALLMFHDDVNSHCRERMKTHMSDQLMKIYRTTVDRYDGVLRESAANSKQKKVSLASIQSGAEGAAGGVVHGGDGQNSPAVKLAWPAAALQLYLDQLQCIPEEVPDSRKIDWYLVIMEALPELATRLASWLRGATKSQKSLPSASVMMHPFCLFIIEHSSFCLELTKEVDAWMERSITGTDANASEIFSEVDRVCRVYEDNRLAAVDSIQVVIAQEVRDILKSGLFRAGWLDSVKCVACLRSLIDETFGVLLGSLAVNSDSGAVSVQNILISCFRSVVSVYLEVLFTSSSNISMNVTTIARLTEDLELITKMMNDWRERVYSRNSTAQPHIVQQKESNTRQDKPHRGSTKRLPSLLKRLKKSADSNVKLAANFSTTVRMESAVHSEQDNGVDEWAAAAESFADCDDNRINPIGEQESTATSAKQSAQSESANEDSARLRSFDTMDNNGTGQQQSVVGEVDSKSLVNSVLQPLTHVVLAIQMSNQYLPDFVKTELYRDFGISCLNIWQLIMYWRNEQRDDILEAFDKLFGDWRVVALRSGSGDGDEIDSECGGEETKPKVSMPYIAKIKAANVVKF